MVRVVDCHAGVLGSNPGGPKRFSPWNYFTVLESVNCLSTERYMLICTIRQVKKIVDKYIMAIYLSMDKWKTLLFPHPCLCYSYEVGPVEK